MITFYVIIKRIPVEKKFKFTKACGAIRSHLVAGVATAAEGAVGVGALAIEARRQQTLIHVCKHVTVILYNHVSDCIDMALEMVRSFNTWLTNAVLVGIHLVAGVTDAAVGLFTSRHALTVLTQLRHG